MDWKWAENMLSCTKTQRLSFSYKSNIKEIKLFSITKLFIIILFLYSSPEKPIVNLWHGFCKKIFSEENFIKTFLILLFKDCMYYQWNENGLESWAYLIEVEYLLLTNIVNVIFINEILFHELNLILHKRSFRDWLI